ncbi:Na(+)-translocating NADH-quinone reductase subunit C [Endozoicomonas sp. SM1973]|uniref:Na(+)-translocating NADH-quinone reductase subunit C n=1 Tax=Spartinivicinus marinus TaxID=2994442 RepID=A0A853HT80_9GAMM|nr:Na(+)-translocating NADH-quinone reductase subunit C [Spartinivicinus marinus]MCX4029406.1 Na(+)-translocating NADH-quinone reductase subunit C [Spartinivicinus marinus]NYZ64980.1 Na(+)-translocating NADH-quinone reductase subunit C [Spartinivicinus marinus]
MSANNDTIQRTVIVTVLLCLVCSIVVSSAAVFLKPAQTENKKLSMQRSILEIAGLMEEGATVKEQFKQIKTKIVDLRTGKFTDAVDAQAYEQRSAAKNPKLSAVLSGEDDIASIKRRAHYATVYLVENQGKVEKLILPVHGYGLWSTMYGFLALEGDTKTVVGLGFYDHGETPGLGGEVDNPKWKAQWPGKQVFNDQFGVDISVVKGGANPGNPSFKHQVDGLAGATLTSRGLQNLLHFWLGENGFGPFLTNVRKGEA